MNVTSTISSFPATVAELQDIANRYLQLQDAERLVTTVWVVRVIGSHDEWRMIETERSATNALYRQKRMLCFETAAEMRRCLLERVAWRQADNYFISQHMSTPGDFPGVTADWVHSKDFDEVFQLPRAKLRQQICQTAPHRTVHLHGTP